jgi:hypothetical protein
MVLLRAIFAARVSRMERMLIVLQRGKVHYSVPSFVPETASTFFHEECWRKVVIERKKGAAKQPRPRQSHRRSPSRKHSSVALKAIS